MAILTWQNINTPIGTGAGDLIGTATDSFASAMDTLRGASERARANRQAAYSTDALMRMTGIQDPAEIAAYAQSLDGKMLTPEAQALLLGQEDRLLGRQKTRLDLEGARDDLDWTRNDRQGMTNAGEYLAMARFDALTRGEINNPAEAIAADPFAARHMAAGMGNLGADRASYMQARDEEYGWNRKVEANSYEDHARDIVTRLMQDPDVTDTDTLQTLAHNQPNDDPRLWRAIQDAAAEVNSDRLGIHDSSLPGYLETGVIRGPEGDIRLSDELHDLGIERAYIEYNRADQLSRTPMVEFSDVLSQINSAEGDVLGEGAKEMLTNMGIDTAGTQFSGLNNDLDDLADEAYKRTGKKPKREELMAAAIIAARTSNIPFRDVLVHNERGALEVLDQVFSDERTKASITERENSARVLENFDNYEAKLQEQNRKWKIASQRGNAEGMADAEAEINRLVAEYRKDAEIYQARRTGDQGEGKEGTEQNSNEETPTIDEDAVINATLGGVVGQPGQTVQPPIDPRSVLGLAPDPFAQPLPAMSSDERLNRKLKEVAERGSRNLQHNTAIADQVERMWAENEAAQAAGLPPPHRPMDIQILEERIR